MNPKTAFIIIPVFSPSSVNTRLILFAKWEYYGRLWEILGRLWDILISFSKKKSEKIICCWLSQKEFRNWSLASRGVFPQVTLPVHSLLQEALLDAPGGGGNCSYHAFSFYHAFQQALPDAPGNFFPLMQFTNYAWCSMEIASTMPSPTLPYAPTCSHKLSHAPTCSYMLPYAPTCSHMIPHANTCSQMLQHAPICSHMLLFPPTCSYIFSHAPISSHMLPYTPKCSHILPHALTCPHMLPYTPTCCHMLSLVRYANVA